jgi:hypothetical protein
MQEMPLFVCATRRGWTVASENGRPKGPFVTAGQAVSFAARAIDRLRARGRHAWIVMEQPEIVERDLALPQRRAPLSAMPGDGLCGCSGW